MRSFLISSLTLLIAHCSLLTCPAQRYINLTAPEVRIDSVLPHVTFSIPLEGRFQDSTYTVSIEYPEFIPMKNADIRNYQRITNEPLPRLPKLQQQISVSRKQGSLDVTLVPLVYRGKKYQKMVSFMLKVKSKKADGRGMKAESRGLRAEASTGVTYASHSVLQEGKWAKIRVPQTGIYRLSDDLVHSAGFSSASKVRVFGYGGGMQPEKLTADYLSQTDDLKEVPTCVVNGQRVFHAIGPVTWDSSNLRIRNPYSNYGYYFLTEGEPQTVSSEEFLSSCYPAGDDYNSLYEVDDFAWYPGGRNLYDAVQIAPGGHRDYTVAAAGQPGKGSVTVVVSASWQATVTVTINGEAVGEVSIPKRQDHDVMRTATKTFDVSNLQASNKITLTAGAGTGIMRLDHISIHCDEPKGAPDLAAGTFPVPEFVETVSNQDRHGDEAADMIIIIPTSKILLTQAERIKQLHIDKDSLRIRIIPANELYNEFSSGTPDANAYRRYLRMLYDRATNEADMPRYLLLMGDGAWDNRMLSSAWKGYQPDDFLLCYESENSYSSTDCYVTDDYFCLLDEGEGGDMLRRDKADVAVGRFPVRNEEQAKILVDKVESYLANRQAGAWQNTVCVMGDDGNENAHMKDADAVASVIERLQPAMQVKRVMWDAYPRTSSATGNRYPDVERILKQQMTNGALIMNYSGHGAPSSLSHEYVLTLKDFEATTSTRLPLWLTASCDIMPFDGQEENIGETALLNSKGGAIAFFGTTRTVYQSYNRTMNLAFTRQAMTVTNGQNMPIGEAVRQAKNELINSGSDQTANKLQYTLLGDPALRLAMPTLPVVIDDINGKPVSSTMDVLQFGAGTTVTVSGHVATTDGSADTSFSGMVTATVRDAAEEITCRRNDASQAKTAFVFTDRDKTLYQGSDSIRNGRFTFSFAVPRDISYSSATGLINIYAVNNEKSKEASGYTDLVSFGGTGYETTDTIGPSVFCYLNSSSFVDGGNTNKTPYFIAELADSCGINATGNGIGHDLQLVIDGELSRTYILNDYFVYDFGSHTKGTVGFSIPELDEGPHKLQFRAWDILNNSTTKELNFNVVKGLSPEIIDVECTRNPATTTTGFRIIHDRAGSNMDIVLDIFDFSGRLLWQHAESGVPTDNSYTINWDLCIDGGRRLQTGVYLYRIRVSSDNSSYASKAKKLIILSSK